MSTAMTRLAMSYSGIRRDIDPWVKTVVKGPTVYINGGDLRHVSILATIGHSIDQHEIERAMPSNALPQHDAF